MILVFGYRIGFKRMIRLYDNRLVFSRREATHLWGPIWRSPLGCIQVRFGDYEFIVRRERRG